jgi:hypothetical protein
VTGLIVYCGRDSMCRDLVMPAVHTAARAGAHASRVLPGPGAATTGVKLSVFDSFSEFLGRHRQMPENEAA